MSKIRWGILSTGMIAGLFVEGLRDVADAEVAAVGSRTRESAEAFGERYGIPRRHGSYEALAADPDVDVIYIGTPHNLHAANTRTCLEAGKAVLCEKPFALNAEQARGMVALARKRGLFLMEAMWTRFRPHMVELRRLLAEGVIGEPRMLHTNFGFRIPFDPKHRLFDPALGGGALLDVGVYPISLAHMVFGTPEAVVSLAALGETGVDEQMSAVLRFSGGRLAVCSAATRTKLPLTATISGTEGQIELPPAPWSGDSQLLLRRPDGSEEPIAITHVGNGYNYQVEEVHACLRAGRGESAIMSLDESIAIMANLDAIRAPWGLRYPGE